MLVSPCHIVGTQTMEGLQCELVGCVEPRTWPSEWIYIVTKRRFIYSYGLTFCTFYLLPPPSSLFLQELEGNEDTDDESSISNDDGSLASESEDVQNDVVVKLEEVADLEENNPQPTAQSSNSPAPALVSDSDGQNDEVKIEEIVDWDEINPPQIPLTGASVSVSDLNAQNIVVKMEEIDREENQEDY